MKPTFDPMREMIERQQSGEVSVVTAAATLRDDEMYNALQFPDSSDDNYTVTLPPIHKWANRVCFLYSVGTAGSGKKVTVADGNDGFTALPDIEFDAAGQICAIWNIAGKQLKVLTAPNTPEIKVAKVALAAATGNGGVLGWQNPEDSAILVTGFVLDVTTEATGAANIDCGTAADASTSSDNLIDGADIGTAAGVFDNVDDAGTNGKKTQRLDAKGGTTDHITGTASADPAGLEGYAYITYHRV